MESNIVFGPCQAKPNRPPSGVGHCVVGGLWCWVCGEGACETRSREGTTRAGKGDFARFAPKLH